MRRFLAVPLAITWFLFSASFGYPLGSKSSKHILDNGLTVLISEIPTSPVVAVYGLVKTGSAAEGRFLGSGISHFLEHMLFKGTTRRGVGELAARIQAEGGHINASTGTDHTLYTMTVPSESFAVALDTLADMLMNATMEADQIEKERSVIFNEMRLHEDDPGAKLGELVSRNVYLYHPYQHPVIGYKTLLAEISREDLIEYYRTYYTSNNIILSVAGHINTEEVLPQIQNAFKDFKRTRYLSRTLPQEPPQISQRWYEEEYPTDLARVAMAFQGVSLLDEDLYALDVLAEILGQGRSSRLYLDVYKNKGLVHDIGASNFTPVDKGIFEITALLEPKNIEQTIQAVLEQIALVKRNGVRDAELQKAKRQVLSDYVHGHQSAGGVAYNQAMDEAFAGDHRFSEKYVDHIAKLTPPDIQRAARRYLVDSALSVVVLKPKGQGDSQKSTPPDRQPGEIQKHLLANGLTVLLREDPTFPLVSVRLALHGGVREELVGLNGLSKMMTELWMKGTKAYSANALAEKVESLGMRLGSYAGNNTFGLSFTALSGDLDVVLSLLAELVKNPTFPQQEIPQIKENMLADIRQRNDNIFRFSYHTLQETLFTEHPLRFDEDGTVESIERMRREDIVQFYQHLSVPRNMVLSVFGDIDAVRVLAMVTQHLGALKARTLNLKTHREPPLTQPREKTLAMPKEQAMVMFGFHGTTFFNEDRYGLEVLTAILGSSFSGRLFNLVREQLGEAYTLDGDSVPGIDAGLISFYVLTTEGKIPVVRDLLTKEIQRIQKEDVPAQELDSIKTYLKGTFKASLEKNSALGFTSGLDELYGLGFNNYQQYDRHINGVSAQDIQRLAQKYLDLNKAAVVVIKPQKPEE